MYIEYIPHNYNNPKLSETWAAFGASWFHIHVFSEEENVRWEWGECFWTANILAEGEIAGRSLRKMHEHF